jgi:hypothetical protein
LPTSLRTATRRAPTLCTAPSSLPRSVSSFWTASAPAAWKRTPPVRPWCSLATASSAMRCRGTSLFPRRASFISSGRAFRRSSSTSTTHPASASAVSRCATPPTNQHAGSESTRTAGTAMPFGAVFATGMSWPLSTLHRRPSRRWRNDHGPHIFYVHLHVPENTNINRSELLRH